MEWVIAMVIGVIFAAGVTAIRRGTRIHLLAGLTLLSQSVNLAVFTAGGLVAGRPPVQVPTFQPGQVADPLPQALVLTAIVIGLGITAFLLALLVREAGLFRRRTKAGPHR